MFNVTTMAKSKMQNRMPKFGFYHNPSLEYQSGRHERLLRTVNSIAYSLFSMEKSDFNRLITESLEKLGNCVNAERIAMWKNYAVGGNLRIMRYAKWNSPLLEEKLLQPIADPIPNDVSIEEYLPDWETIMAEQNPVFLISRDMQEPFRSIAMDNGIRSVLIVPVFSLGNYWGFISLLTYTNDRLYSSAEKELLRTGGALIASAIEHNKTTKELICARDEAQKNTKAKSEFLSRMSHELRTPMNAIIGMLDIARNSPEKREQYLDKIGASSRQLLGIINDVLDISKIEANKLELESREFDFEKMFQNVIDVIRIKMDEKRQNFIRKGFVFKRKITGDELRLSQIFLNLFSNAVKFTPEEGNISVEINTKENVKDSETVIRVEIKDSGIGMTPLQQRKLFRPFEQTEKNTSRKFGGTGLGLVICKRIVNLMGGEIWAESEAGKGSSFIFEIKTRWGDVVLTGEKADSDPVDIPQWQGKTILAVEDVDVNREILNVYLKKTGIAIDFAVNGLDALTKFRENPGKYSLILMDIKMPDMNGLEATRLIRSIEAWQLPEFSKRIPVIAMTANVFSEDVKECLDAGMNSHVPKPIDAGTLFEKMKTFLQ